MKRFLVILLAVILLLSLTSCVELTNGNDSAEIQQEQISVSTGEDEDKGKTEVENEGQENEGNNDDTPQEPEQTYYTVRFNSNSAIVIANVRVKEGEKVEKPSLSTKSDGTYDYELKSWQYNGSDWNFETDFITGDIELVAVWEKVGTSKQFLPE